MSIKELQPNLIWKHFDAINAIPRASTKEEQIIKYMIDFGKSLQLETVVDDIGNVIIKKPATLGKENHKTVVLQGHLDMVHQKVANSDFNFDIQGIEMYVDDDWIKAKETTLGADNGIGVAVIMAVLSSNNIEHPSIEALFTIDEEMGMTGAMALKNNQLKGKVLLNLDTEKEEEIIIGCAGGVDVEIDGDFKIVDLDSTYNFYQITVNGLTGGHSGMDIHLNRANAIKVLIEILIELPCRVCYINAGKLTNVIPRYGTAYIASKDETRLLKVLKNVQQNIKDRYNETDGSITISINQINEKFSTISTKNQGILLSQLFQIPNGVYLLTKGRLELVQTSNNLAKISFEDGTYKIACHIRSSVDKERDKLVNKIKQIFSEAVVIPIGAYPGWKPRSSSSLLKLAKKCYKNLHGKYPRVKSIHAGLECGILSGTFPEMEMISFGPNIRGAHSPEERLQISSTQRFWKFLIILLSEI